MALKLRPTGLGSGIDKDRPDYSIYSGDWAVGRIYENRREELVIRRQRRVVDEHGGDERRA
jgi:hypothetical protein